ncbi:tetratricopeptide repeat protein [Candidatus Poribacteria bacterium]|nr:tetratricopeptide repeat protein [Candidatus Poribacteria bacterium]
MKHFKAISILVLIIVCLPLGSNLQAQTGGETPELVILPDADAGLNSNMTRVAGLYTKLMWATYYRTGERSIPKSKALYDALIEEIDDATTLLEDGLLSAEEVSFIYAERASLRYPKLQDINGAEEDAKTAIELNSDNVKATWVLAQIVTERFLYQMERNRNGRRLNTLQKEMFDTLKRVVDLDPDHNKAYFYLGSMARDLGDTELAITSFKALTRIIPYDDRYYRELAELYKSQNRLDEAVQSYERVVTIRPEQKSARNRLGQLHLQAGDYPAAIKTFLSVLPPLEGQLETNGVRERATPNVSEEEIEAHQGISLAYQAQNDFEQSEFHITRAINLLEERAKRTRTGFRTRSSERIELANRIQEARYTLGQIYLKFNVPRKAVQTFTKILSTNDKYVPALSGIGMAYQMQDDVKRAEIYLRRAIELSAEEELPDAYNALGYLYAEQGINLDEAAALVRRALKSVPKSGAYLDSLGLIYFKQGKLDAAIENLEQALHYLPDTPEILLHLADAYLGKGLKQKALQTLEQAVLLEPNNAELRQKLERSLQQSGVGGRENGFNQPTVSDSDAPESR